MRDTCRTAALMLALAAAAALPCAHADTDAASTEPAASPAADGGFTLGGNVMLVSDYLFRGITVTEEKPALQAELDILHPAGWYLVLWTSNVSDNVYTNGDGIEIDAYAGRKWELGNGFSLDTGYVGYFYPNAYGVHANGQHIKYDTHELKLGLSRDVVSLNLWYGIDKYWAGIWFDKRGNVVDDTRGSAYVELNINPALTEILTLNLHAGYQNVNNSPDYDFTDLKAGVTADLKAMKLPGWMLSGAVVYNNGDKDAWYYVKDSGNVKPAVGTTLLVTLARYF